MSSTEQTFTQLCDLIQAEMTRLSVPGVAVGVIHGDEEHVAGLGVTNVNHPLPVTDETMFQIGSTTKTITGTVIMRLVEQGKLDLDTPIRAYLPDLRLADESVAAQVTIRHLLTHTTGWVGDIFDDTGWGDDDLAIMVGRMREIPQITPLGQVWSYNNANYYLAGRLIEIVTGQTYEAATHALVLAPLGMTRSFFLPQDVITHRFAVGHIVRDNGPEVAAPWALARCANPVGGLSSSVRDQLRYARFHMGDGTAADGARLLSAASIAAMQTPIFPMDIFGGWRGITWTLRDVGGIPTVAHGGATNGQLSAFIFAPQARFALTILTNADRGGQLHAEATKWALEHFLGAVDPTPTPITVSAETLAAYAGHYEGRLSDIILSVGAEGIMMQVIPNGHFPLKDSRPGPTPPPVRMAVIGENLLLALDAPFKDNRLEFLRDANGAIEWLRFGGRIRRKIT